MSVLIKGMGEFVENSRSAEYRINPVEKKRHQARAFYFVGGERDLKQQRDDVFRVEVLYSVFVNRVR
jgi:hypothetical protein